jgi:archaeosine-15-forming tRNA-guanine transglycosylase
MKAMRLTSGIRLLLAHLLAFSFIANAGSAGISELQAPALRDCPTEKKRDLGVWDDVFVCDDQDVIVLRRGEGFFSMSPSASASLKKLATAPAARTTRIIDYAGSGDRLWLFLQSDKAAP